MPIAVAPRIGLAASIRHGLDGRPENRGVESTARTSASVESQCIVGLCETASKLRVNAPVKSSRNFAFMTSGTRPRQSYFLPGIPEAVIRKLTGHRSRELEAV
jgi:hypothetical protein